MPGRLYLTGKSATITDKYLFFPARGERKDEEDYIFNSGRSVNGTGGRFLRGESAGTGNDNGGETQDLLITTADDY